MDVLSSMYCGVFWVFDLCSWVKRKSQIDCEYRVYLSAVEWRSCCRRNQWRLTWFPAHLKQRVFDPNCDCLLLLILRHCFYSHSHSHSHSPEAGAVSIERALFALSNKSSKSLSKIYFECDMTTRCRLCGSVSRKRILAVNERFRLMPVR